MPALAAGPNQRPWLSESFRLDLSHLPVASAALVSLGTSRSAWSGIPLPFDLTSSGMPGCQLLTGMTLAFPVVNLGGRATWSATLPGNQSLVGGQLYSQAVVVDRAANAGGLSWSNGGEGRFGLK